VVDQEGASTVWEELFATDQEAYAEFQDTLEIEGILVGANQVRDQVFMGRAVVENLDVFGRLDEKLGEARAQKRGTKKKESRHPARDSVNYPTSSVKQVLQCSERLKLSALATAHNYRPLLPSNAHQQMRRALAQQVLAERTVRQEPVEQLVCHQRVERR